MTEADHDRLVENLANQLNSTLDNDTTVEQCSDDVSVIRTHISSVILVGNQAYKLKRPVKFSFLDFSSIDKRHAFCMREFEVNRRSTPDIYEEVLPVTGSLEHPQINGCGNVIDWAVRMRRFEKGMLLSELARRKALLPEQVTGLARRVAKFHQEQDAIDPENVVRQKSPQQWLLESLSEIQQLVEHSRNDSIKQGDSKKRAERIVEQIEEIRSVATAQWRSSEALRAQRLQDGWIRECHGDLHLNNITLLNGQAVMFDAIEFDDDLRKIDLINEVAFTFMDFHAHGLPELAWLFLNEYEQRIGDYSGLTLLPHFTRYRAIIRAKVALLSDETQKSDAPIWMTEAFERYWTIALNPPMGPNPARLFLVAGLSGSGKSTVARILSNMTGAVWLRADSERKRLFPDPDGATRYSAHASEKTYQHLVDITTMLLNAGFSVVVDATFLDKKGHISKFEQIVADLESTKDSGQINDIRMRPKMTFLVCEADAELMKQRISDRLKHGSDPSEATQAILKSQLAMIGQERNHYPEFAKKIKNNGTIENIEMQLKKLLIN